MQCSKCGTEIKEGCLFCHNCGEAVQMVPDYEPVLDDIQIRLAQAQTKMPSIPTVEKLEEKTEEKIEQIKKINWKIVGILSVAFLGIAAFALSYGSVLKQQNPGAMQQQEKEEPKQEIAIVEVSEPKFSLPGGEYSHYISVELTTDVSGTIYYTLDGATPDESSHRYTSPIRLLEGTTVIRAFMIDQNGNSSDVSSEVYVLEFGAPDPPTIIPQTGDYVGEQYVRILVPEGCLAYYTLDCSNPTESSELYTGEFLMPTGTTIVHAMLEDELGNLSGISSVVYTCINVEQE